MIEVLVVDTEYRVFAVTLDPTLENFKGLLNGGWLEGIGGHTDAGKWCAYCDEEGKLKRLPINYLATAWAQENGYPLGDILCGPVIFTGPPDEEGEDTSAAPWMHTSIRDMERRMKNVTGSQG